MLIELPMGFKFDKINKEEENRRMQRIQQEENRRMQRIQQEEEEEFKRSSKKVKELLKEKNKKITVSDIDAFLKHGNIHEIKQVCEKLYARGEISFAGNGRYFVLTEGADEKKETASTKTEKSEAVDVKSELKKYKEMLDEGLINEEDYESKKDTLLGL
tara:strand:- start:741 stop:1217 length:477 start_codon:yes stop_codon:yes gene_type:complete